MAVTLTQFIAQLIVNLNKNYKMNEIVKLSIETKQALVILNNIRHNFGQNVYEGLFVKQLQCLQDVYAVGCPGNMKVLGECSPI